MLLGFAGGLARATASFRITDEMPSPRDVSHVVIFATESSNVLFECSNASSMSSSSVCPLLQQSLGGGLSITRKTDDCIPYSNTTTLQYENGL